MKKENVMFWRTSGGVTLMATPSEFNKTWKDYILARGETYKAEPVVDPRLDLATFDQVLEDRNGKLFSVWHIYAMGQVIHTKWTVGDMTSGLDEKTFPVAA